MTFAARIPLAALAMVALLAAATAAERPTPERAPVAQGVSRAVHVGTVSGPETQGYSPGSANRLSALAPWVETGTGVVDALFFDDETLTVAGSVFTDKDRDLKVTIEVLSASGGTIFASDFVDQAFPGEVVTYFADVGVLGQGFYQVRMKFKQGKKSVGVRFWFRVDPAPALAPAA